MAECLPLERTELPELNRVCSSDRCRDELGRNTRRMVVHASEVSGVRFT
jgi:hypothetical protein